MTTEIRTITGNVVADPELRVTPNGTAVSNIRVAVNHSARTDPGDWVDAGTDFYTVPVWEREAENAARTLRKGTRITVTGQVHRRAWLDNDRAVQTRMQLRPLAPIGVALDFQSATVTKNQRDDDQGNDPQ
ncbi:MAG: single-stranded DNA-binding protein [Cumulibacter sp.]